MGRPRRTRLGQLAGPRTLPYVRARSHRARPRSPFLSLLRALFWREGAGAPFLSKARLLLTLARQLVNVVKRERVEERERESFIRNQTIDKGGSWARSLSGYGQI